MGAYHQMGHDSWNLVGEKPLHRFEGLILSPVNDSPDAVTQKLSQLRERKQNLDIILDPQFYEPRSARGHLIHWPHFSDDVDTVNLQDMNWWEKRSEALSSVASIIGANAICSPATIPRLYDDDYYRWTVDCANITAKHASDRGLGILLTAIVRLPELAHKGRSETVASILTSTGIDRIYLVLSDDIPPRTQRTDVEGLAGAIKLIRLLENAGTRVLVAFSGLDMILWKAAGASGVASGKFFNLRRFVPGRFEEDGAEGGRVVPYWTDTRLITWLREDDIRLLDKNALIDRPDVIANPYSERILEILDAGTGEPWVRYGWRQYLYWFQETEAAISNDSKIAKMMLRNADSAWGNVNDSEIYLYDRQNTGDWIRPWLNAVNIGLK